MLKLLQCFEYSSTVFFYLFAFRIFKISSKNGMSFCIAKFMRDKFEVFTGISGRDAAKTNFFSSPSISEVFISIAIIYSLANRSP
jgi:hypothetical protein